MAAWRSIRSVAAQLTSKQVNLCRKVSPVAAGCPDVVQETCLCPSGDRLGIDAEHSGDDTGRIEPLRHVAVQELNDVALIVPPASALCPGMREFALFCPLSDRVGIDAEHLGDFGGSE